MPAPENLSRALADMETLRLELGERALKYMVVSIPPEQLIEVSQPVCRED